MAINLPEHSRTAYEAACTMLSAYGKAAVIQPAGSRNYLIGFRLCADHPDKQFLWLTPSACIYRVQTAYLASVNEHVPDQIVSLTYDELDSQLPKLSASFRPDCCILDEYQSAESAASAAAYLRRLFPKILLFGLSSSGTSRPENRKLTAEPDLFFRAVAYEMTLGEAIVRGILKAPVYIRAVSFLRNEPDQYEQDIASADSKAVRDAAAACLLALRNAADQAEKPESVLKRYLPDPCGKYIVFVPDTASAEQDAAQILTWFRHIGSSLHFYSGVSSAEDAVRRFCTDTSGCLRVLCCTGIPAECTEQKDLSGAVFLHASGFSERFKQRIGWLLSASGLQKPVIFEIAGSAEDFSCIDSVQEEIRNAVSYCRSHGGEKRIVTRQLAVIDRTEGCSTLLRRLRTLLTAPRDARDYVFERNFHAAAEYFRRYGNLECPHNYIDASGIRLGTWINYLRGRYKKQGRSVLTDEQFRMLNAIGMRWSGKHDQQWNQYYQLLKIYVQRTGNSDVPVTWREGDVPLGRWYRRQKELFAAGKLPRERAEHLSALGMRLTTLDPWEAKFRLAKAYSESHGGSLTVPNDYVVQGVRLSKWLHEQQLLGKGGRKKKLSPEQKRKLESIGMTFGIPASGRTWEKHYQAVKSYVERTGLTEIPDDLRDSDRVNLKVWVSRQLAAAKKGLLSPEQAEKLRTIGLLRNPEKTAR